MNFSEDTKGPKEATTETPLPLVSAIVPTWNRREDLLACLRSLKRQKGVRLEIIVADDGSTDGSEAAVRAEFPEVIWLGDGRNMGHPFRRNQAILASHGDYLLHLDSDVEMTDDHVLRRMVEHCRKDQRLGEIGGEIALNTGLRDRAFGLCLGRMDYPYRVSASAEDGLVECDFLPSLHFMTRRHVTFEAGGYDPYYIFGGPDTDFGFCVRHAGYVNKLAFDCAAYHKAGSSGRRKDASYRYCLGGVRFDLRHHGLHVFFSRLAWYTARWCAEALYGLARGVVAMTPGRRPDWSRCRALAPLVAAYWWYLFHLWWAFRSIRRNYLTAEEMERFVRWKTKQGGST